MMETEDRIEVELDREAREAVAPFLPAFRLVVSVEDMGGVENYLMSAYLLGKRRGIRDCREDVEKWR